MFLAGHGCLLMVYGWLAVAPTGIAQVAGALLFLGAYYAATDGVLAAMASAVLSAEARATA